MKATRRTRIMSVLMMLCLLVSIVGTMSIAAQAAAGDLMSNPVVATFGSQYRTSWTRHTAHLNHYIRFTVPQQGIVTINTTKPRDERGYHGLKFTIFDVDGEPVFYHDNFLMENAKSNDTFGVGLVAGTYYLTIQPYYYVGGGVLDTCYTLSFTPNDHCEIEPNGEDKLANKLATPVNFGEKYIGYTDRVGHDYFKFPVVVGQEYRVVFHDNVFAEMDRQLMTVKVLLPNGEVEYIDYMLRKHLLSDGSTYAVFKANATGTAYLHIGFSSLSVFEYEFTITNQTCAKNGHTYGAWTVTKAAGCGAPGEQTRTCTCGAKETQVIPAKSHTFGGWWTEKAATCTEPGQSLRQCIGCGARESQVIPVKGHVFGGWWTEKQPTYTTEGLQLHRCVTCNAREGKAIPKLVMTGASDWAVAQIIEGVEAGIVPAALQNNYTKPITRAEFCALATALYEKQFGTITAKATFTDTTDANVQKMAGLGVVNGVGNNQFAPNALLTREQAATMLARLVNVMGKPFAASAATFADNAKISSWAFDAVGQVQAAGIMGGVGNNTFSPETQYTREQSILTMVRILNYIKK